MPAFRRTIGCWRVLFFLCFLFGFFFLGEICFQIENRSTSLSLGSFRCADIKCDLLLILDQFFSERPMLVCIRMIFDFGFLKEDIFFQNYCIYGLNPEIS